MGGDNFLTVIRTSSIWNWARIASAIVSARASKSWNDCWVPISIASWDNLGVVDCMDEVIGFAGGGEVGRQLKVYFIFLPKLTLCFCDAVIAVKSNAFENDFVPLLDDDHLPYCRSVPVFDREYSTPILEASPLEQ